MTNALTTAKPTTGSELFPIERSDVTRAIFRRSRRERDPNSGQMILATPLSVDERQMISGRLAHLAKHLGGGRQGDIAAAVSAMLSGWDKSADDTAANATVAQFVAVLSDPPLPIWAIKRACGRFSRGEVQPEEIGEKRLSRSFFPSTAHLRMVAEAAVRPHWDEASIGSMLLNAITERQETPEKRAETAIKIQAMHEGFKRDVARNDLTEAAEQERQRHEREATRMAEDRARKIAEYEAQGLEPVFSDKDQKVVTSLSLLRQMGWTIEDGPGGRPVLVRPREVAHGGV